MKESLPLSVWGLRGEGVEQFSRSATLVSGLDHHLFLLDHVHEFDTGERPLLIGRETLTVDEFNLEILNRLVIQAPGYPAEAHNSAWWNSVTLPRPKGGSKQGIQSTPTHWRSPLYSTSKAQ